MIHCRHFPTLLTFDLVYNVYSLIKNFSEKKAKGLALLLDPDKLDSTEKLNETLTVIERSGIDMVFVGGSLMVGDQFHPCIRKIRQSCSRPLVIFPGSPTQISAHADAILFLSLISGRNPDLLIGQHIQAAPILRKMNIEVISTGYMLVDCGKPTAASYISHTFPLPWNKPEIAAATAIAGEMLGLSCIYLDGGSGAERPVNPAMIHAVRQSVVLPLIVGGGINHETAALEAWSAGADIVVIGSAFEENPEILVELSRSRNQISART